MEEQKINNATESMSIDTESQISNEEWIKVPDEILTVFEDNGSVEIDHEEISVRSPRSKTFKMADGSYRKIHYSHPIHIFNMETGCYEEISNTFKQASATLNDSNDFEGFECKSTDMTVKLAENIASSNIFKISKGSHKLYFRLIGQENDNTNSARLYNSKAVIETSILQTKAKTSDKGIDSNINVDKHNFSRFIPLHTSDNKVIYEGALPDADIECSVGINIFNTSIKIKNITDQCRFIYDVKAIGLNTETLSDGTINFYVNKLSEDEEGNATLKKEIIFIIGQPVITDACGEIQPSSMRLERNGTGWLLILEVPDNFNYSAPVSLNMNVRTPDANTEGASIKSIRRIEPESAKPYIIKYKKQSDKQILINAIEELGSAVIVQADMFMCVTTNLKNSQLSSLSKLECIERIERDYDHSLQTMNGEALNQEFFSSQTNNDITPAEPEENNDSNLVPDEIIEEQNQASNGHAPRNPYSIIHSQGIKGQGIKIAVLDTGIAEHPDLNIAGGISFVGDENDYNDTNGHGTKMAGIIAASGINEPSMTGCAPDAEIYAVKVADEYGHVKISAILKALEWCIKNYINIVNMSFGTYNYSKILKEALEYADSNGIVLVASAGNEGQFENEHRIMYPAAYPGVLAVGAGTGAEPLDFSNVNTRLDFIAPGYKYTTSTNGRYTEAAGTSVSAAYMSGIIALTWSSNRQLQKNRLLNLIKNTAYVQEGHSGYVGYGAPSIASVLSAEDDLYDINAVKAERNSAVLENTPVFEQPISTGNASAMAVSSGSGNNGSGNNGSGSGDIGSYPGSSMVTAIPLTCNTYVEDTIDTVGKQIWYKYTANADGAHPNGGPGLYLFRHTKSDEYPLRSICDIYDSNGAWLATNGDNLEGSNMFNIEIEFQKGNTYYIRIRGAINCTGRYRFLFKAYQDDYSNHSAYAYNLGDVYNNKSIDGGFYYTRPSDIDFYAIDFTPLPTDIDYFFFYSSKNIVVDIYTEGDAKTTGKLYNYDGLMLAESGSGGEDDNFKMSFQIEAGKIYFISVENTPSLSYFYTLKIAFKNDWTNSINEYDKYVSWLDYDQTTVPNYDPYDLSLLIVYRSRDFISDKAKYMYSHRIIQDVYNNKENLNNAIQSEISSEVIKYLVSIGINAFNLAAGILFDFALIVYQIMSYIDNTIFNQKCNDIDGTSNYIIVTNSIGKSVIYVDHVPSVNIDNFL